MIFGTFIGVDFTGSISLGVIILALVGSAVAIWKTQSITALRTANDDLRKDRDDWKLRAEDQKSENDRLAQKVVDLVQLCNDNQTEIARLQERTDTSQLAKEVVVSAFRDEMRLAVARIEADNQAKLLILTQQQDMIKALVGLNGKETR